MAKIFATLPLLLLFVFSFDQGFADCNLVTGADKDNVFVYYPSGAPPPATYNCRIPSNTNYGAEQGNVVLNNYARDWRDYSYANQWRTPRCSSFSCDTTSTNLECGEAFTSLDMPPSVTECYDWFVWSGRPYSYKYKRISYFLDARSSGAKIIVGDNKEIKMKGGGRIEMRGAGTKVEQGTISWVLDNDKDGYAAYPVYSVTSTESGTDTDGRPYITVYDADPYLTKSYVKYSYKLGDNDCSDSDNTKWKWWYNYYTDSDGDGYGTGTKTNVCANNSVPANYVTNSTDCNDSNSNVYQTKNTYVDNDADAFTVGSAVSQCIGSSAPSGYTITANKTYGDDCDDNDAETPSCSYSLIFGYHTAQECILNKGTVKKIPSYVNSYFCGMGEQYSAGAYGTCNEGAGWNTCTGDYLCTNIGWKTYSNWTKTSGHDHWASASDGCSANYCPTGSHDWSDTPVESCMTNKSYKTCVLGVCGGCQSGGTENFYSAFLRGCY